jgi:hypothetical protein
LPAAPGWLIPGSRAAATPGNALTAAKTTSALAHFCPKPAKRLFSMFVPDIDAIIFSSAMIPD